MKTLISIIVFTHVFWALVIGLNCVCDLIGCADAVAVMSQWPLIGPIIIPVFALVFYTGTVGLFMYILKICWSLL